MNRKKLITTLIVLIFLIFIVSFLANKFYWYSSIWYFDMIMHTLGGFWVGLAVMYLFPSQVTTTSWSKVIKILILVITIGLAWEIYELGVNDVIAQNAFNKLDTFSDICFDLAGGTLAIFYYMKRILFTNKDEVQLI